MGPPHPYLVSDLFTKSKQSGNVNKVIWQYLYSSSSPPPLLKGISVEQQNKLMYGPPISVWITTHFVGKGERYDKYLQNLIFHPCCAFFPEQTSGIQETDIQLFSSGLGSWGRKQRFAADVLYKLTAEGRLKESGIRSTLSQIISITVELQCFLHVQHT